LLFVVFVMVGVVRGVVFDLDGTLVDTVPLHAKSWVETCRRLGLPVPPVEFVYSLMGLRALDIARLLCGGENAEVALRVKNEVYLSLINDARPVSGAPEVLRVLKGRGLLVGVVTSSSRHVALRVLEVTGLLGFIDALLLLVMMLVGVSLTLSRCLSYWVCWGWVLVMWLLLVILGMMLIWLGVRVLVQYSSWVRVCLVIPA